MTLALKVLTSQMEHDFSQLQIKWNKTPTRSLPIVHTLPRFCESQSEIQIRTDHHSLTPTVTSYPQDLQHFATLHQICGSSQALITAVQQLTTVPVRFFCNREELEPNGQSVTKSEEVQC